MKRSSRFEITFGRRFYFTANVFSLASSLFLFVLSCQWLDRTLAFFRFWIPLQSGKVGFTVSYKSAFGSHGAHTRNLITLLHWIDRFEPFARQNEIPCKFYIFLHFIFKILLLISKFLAYKLIFCQYLIN